MADARRISPAAARRAMDENDALLICGYEDPEKYRAYHLEGSISFSELRSRLDGIAKDRELIFYCA